MLCSTVLSALPPRMVRITTLAGGGAAFGASGLGRGAWARALRKSFQGLASGFLPRGVGASVEEILPGTRERLPREVEVVNGGQPGNRVSVVVRVAERQVEFPLVLA